MATKKHGIISQKTAPMKESSGTTTFVDSRGVTRCKNEHGKFTSCGAKATSKAKDKGKKGIFE